MNWLIQENGQTTRLDAIAIKHHLAAGTISPDAMYWDPGSASWRSIQTIPLAQDESSRPTAIFFLSLAVAALTVLHVINRYDLQQRLQIEFGAAIAVIFTTIFTIATATVGAFLVAKLWDHPARRKGTGATGLMFILATLFLIFETIISVSNVVQVPDVVRLLTAIANHENARLVLDGKGVVKISGPIGSRLTDDFKALEGVYGPLKLIKLSSPGGLVEPALELAAHIEARGTPILIEGDCSSACLLLAVASPRSLAVESATFGFHRISPVLETGSETVQASVNEAWTSYRDFLERRGVPSAVLDEASKHGASSIYSVSAWEMRNYGAIDGVISNSGVPTQNNNIEFRNP